MGGDGCPCKPLSGDLSPWRRTDYPAEVRAGLQSLLSGSGCVYAEGSPEAQAWQYGRRWAETRAQGSTWKPALAPPKAKQRRMIPTGGKATDAERQAHRVVLSIARAFGTGPALVPRYRETSAAPAHDDGAPTHDGTGLALCKRSETVSRAGRAVTIGSDGKPKDPEARKWWQSLSDAERQQVQAWDTGQFKQRGRGFAYRVREFNEWKRSQGVVMVPETRARPAVLYAMANAQLPRVLGDWLLCVALQDANRWPLVSRALESLGHEPWAVEEAGFLLVYGSMQTQRERARIRGMRKADYAARVSAAGDVLARWLEKAAAAIKTPPKSPGTRTNHGDPSGLRPPTWFAPPAIPAPCKSITVADAIANPANPGLAGTSGAWLEKTNPLQDAMGWGDTRDLAA